MVSTFNNSVQMAATARSVSVSGGATSLVDGTRPGETAGSAWRSTLPFAVNGSLSMRTNVDGTMYCGSRACRYLRSDVGVRTSASTGSAAGVYASAGWCRIRRGPWGEGRMAYT